MTVGMVEVDGGELRYEKCGEGSPVVLVHGGSLDASTWDPQVDALARRHTVIRYDLRGHGASSTPTQPFRHYEDLRVLLTRLGITRTSLVGHSMGGRVVIDFALANPELVDRLVLAAPGISGMSFRDPYMLAHMEKLAEARAEGDLEDAVEHIVRMWVDGPHRTPEQVGADVRERCRKAITEAVGRGRAAQELMTELGAIGRVGELGARTLTLYGDKDCADTLDVVRLVARDAPDVATLELPGVGHMIHLEWPETFTGAVLDFLAEPALP